MELGLDEGMQPHLARVRVGVRVRVRVGVRASARYASWKSETLSATHASPMPG